MTFNRMSVTEKIREDLEQLILLTSGDTEKRLTAYEMESQLWWSVLQLGYQLLQLFFMNQYQGEEKRKVVEFEGTLYGYVGPRQRVYWSIFGKIKLKRRAYWKSGQGSVYPLDAALNLPQRQYSYRLQEWVSELSASWAYEDVVSHMKSWFRLSLPKKSLQAMLRDQASHQASYGGQVCAPKIAVPDNILVVQADGKGIPMTAVHSPPPEHRKQLGKTASKEATVTAIYTLSPYRRNPEVIINALLRDNSEEKDQTKRPVPHHKWVAGTLDSQATAIDNLQEQVNRYSSDNLTHRVAVCDGNRGLQNRITEKLPDFTLILDIFHVTGYLWQAVDALLGKDHPMRYQWMHDALYCLLTDDLDYLLTHLRHHDTYLPLAQSYHLQTTIRYLSNQRERMDYQSYLAQGYPIGSGVIEGTCCHLIHDRFEQSGMRWSPTGAQAMLDIRATVLNGHWQNFQTFYRLQEHRILYPYADPDDTSTQIPGQQAA